MSESANPDQIQHIFQLPDRAVGEGAIREAAVGIGLASISPTRCPVCQGGNVLVEGQFRRQFSEEFSKGQTKGYELDPVTEKNVLAILCADCKVRYVIEPDVVFQLREEVLGLTMALSSRVGLAIVPSSTDKVC